MKAAKTCAIAALVMCIVAIAPMRGIAGETIFVANSYDVAAYPADANGDVAPISLTTDMAAPRGIARDASGNLYVTNAATSTVTIYAAGGTGNVEPLAVIGGPDTGLSNPIGVAIDASGRIYVLDRGGPDSITEYAPLGAGSGILDESPTATITGTNTLLVEPVAITIDSSGDIYIVNQFGGPDEPGTGYAPGVLTVYSAGSNGNAAPIAIIRGGATGLVNPTGIALDGAGNIDVTNGGATIYAETEYTYPPSVTSYAAGSNGKVAPISTISGNHTGLNYPEGIALDSSGSMYVTDGSVDVYAAGSNGNTAPTASITGAATGLSEAIGIAIDTSGNVYVLNANGGPDGGGSVTTYPAYSSGDTAPIASLTSSFTGLIGPSGVALDSTGKIYIANTYFGGNGQGSVTIYAAGSYATGSPIATIAGAGTGLYYPIGVAVASNGRIAALNDNNTITEYSAGSDGDAAPLATINIATIGYSFASAIAAGPSGKLYVLIKRKKCNQHFCYETGQGSIAAYPAGADGSVRRIALIDGPDTGLAWPSAIAVDHRGEIYAANQGIPKCPPGCFCSPIGPGSITVYPPGSNGDVKPIATIQGARSRVGLPYGIAIDGNGEIDVLTNGFPGGVGVTGICFNPGSKAPATTDLGTGDIAAADSASIYGPILIYAAGSNGNVAPIGGIGGPLTGLNNPVAIAVGPGGP